MHKDTPKNINTPSEIDHSKGWKYANRELERRFLLTRKPDQLDDQKCKEISDKYLNGTNLRLREISKDGSFQYKLTKKLNTSSQEKNSHWVSTIYLSREEFDVLWQIAGKAYKKKRYYLESKSGHTIGIDEIRLEPSFIWIAEVEFRDTAEMERFQFPFDFAEEVTTDERYSGFELAKRSTF